MLPLCLAAEEIGRTPHISRATKDDLSGINTIVQRAVMHWPMATRIKRRAVTVLQYDRIDLQHYAVYHCSIGMKMLGVIAIDFESNHRDKRKCEMTLHGIYVDPESQGRGVGGALIKFAERQARCRNYDGIKLKAERVSCGFFERCGFDHQAPKSNSDYPYLYRKSILCEERFEPTGRTALLNG